MSFLKSQSETVREKASETPIFLSDLSPERRRTIIRSWQRAKSFALLAAHKDGAKIVIGSYLILGAEFVW